MSERSKTAQLQPPLDIKQIMQLLPHRYPFLLVDRILELDIEKGYVCGQKNVTMNEQFFQGHFPGTPLMPGVLILEALAQAGGILIHERCGIGKIAVLLSVNNAKFRQPVKPGDILYLKGYGVHFSSKGGLIRAEALVADKVVAQAEIGFALVDRDRL